MSVSGSWYLGLSAVLFSIGAVGLLVRRNVLVMFMCVELMLNAANITFVAFAGCSTTSAARRSCSSSSWSPPPRSWSGSGSSCRCSGAARVRPPTTWTC